MAAGTAFGNGMALLFTIDQPIVDVGGVCGFKKNTHFSLAFKKF